MSVLSALRSIETVSQTIANFLTIPILPTDIALFINQIELVKGIVREFSVALAKKTDILNRLSQVETILLATPPNLTTALTLLQLVVLKIKDLPIC